MSDLAEAVRSSVPFKALDLNIAGVVRHPDAQTAELTVWISGKNLDWQLSDDGKEQAFFTLQAVSLSRNNDVLASKMQKWRLSTPAQGLDRLANGSSRIPVTLRVPRRTRIVRVAIASGGEGRLGTAEVDRKTLDAAPALPSPNPQLAPAPSGSKLPAPAAM
jgi:hypothetical protein